MLLIIVVFHGVLPADGYFALSLFVRRFSVFFPHAELFRVTSEDNGDNGDDLARSARCFRRAQVCSLSVAYTLYGPERVKKVFDAKLQILYPSIQEACSTQSGLQWLQLWYKSVDTW